MTSTLSFPTTASGALDSKDTNDEGDEEPTNTEYTSLATQIGSKLRPLILSLLDHIGYKTPTKRSNLSLWHAMLQRASEIGVSLENPQSQRCFECGYTYAAICFPDHPLDAQVYTGIHTWLGTQIDDNTNLKEELAIFEQRFYLGEPLVNPILQGYADTLRSTYTSWDPVTANFIILSSLAFINCNVLEERPEFQSMITTRGGRRWPHYFRDKEGVPEAYSYFTFPKATHPDFSYFLEAIPDMGRVLNLANDVLSFYKEERAGVQKNYIHQRANYEHRDVFEVLKDAAQECIEAAKRVNIVLEGREPYRQAWLDHLDGYLHMHRSIARYRFHEIELAEEKSATIPVSPETTGRN